MDNPSWLAEFSWWLRDHIGVAACLWTLVVCFPIWVILRIAKAFKTLQRRHSLGGHHP